MRLPHLILLALVGFLTACATVAQAATNQFLSSVPKGFYLQSYDDCGIEGRQPHVQMTDCYLWTFGTSDTDDASIKERSAVFSYKGIQALYTNLDPALSYVLAVTYASDHVYKRVQSLAADGVELHGPHALPKARANRLIVKVPEAVTRDGQLALSWKIHGEVNATVSIIELWANAPSTNALQFSSFGGLADSMEGQVFNLAYDIVPNARVTASTPDMKETFTTKTDGDGGFAFKRKDLERLTKGGEITLKAEDESGQVSTRVRTTNLFFEPVHYRPLPEKTIGLSGNSLLLDGMWRINIAPSKDIRTKPLDGPGWAEFKVPGQWQQQGFDVPADKTVAVARTLVIPKEWAGNKVILRFDAIHAGTRYWLNGRELGYAENLFTPVEWDITEMAKYGQANRLDLEMKVATVSEALSYSSAYAFHNLGGIDRSVRLFALPSTHVKQLHLSSELDREYRDGDLKLNLVLDGGDALEEDLSIRIQLKDPSGKTVKHSLPTAVVGSFKGSKAVDLTAHVSTPLQWSAEKPSLYRLNIELRRGGKVLETIERNVGFRKIEIKGRQFYVNGQRVKLAGACHHEFDPLTGRADTMRHAEKDVRLFKEANLNYLRTSHYPPTAELLDAADRIGMYVEVEAPFCWVGPALDSAANLNATLTPTSAMVDYHHTHPSVVVWSIANESHFNRQFLLSNKLCKELDPTRPTTFNHDFANNPLCAATDIANLHYPSMPFDSLMSDDPRPMFLGEYFFPVCHEQTDVSINPGLRELWGHGHAEPDSAFGRSCTADFEKPPLKPGLKPGGWSYIVKSDRVIGGAIWASHDDAFYFSETNHAGYAWHHGFWGLIDYWRRPKPEWWLARHIFSPVWLETRHVDFVPGQKSIRLPVENRFAFTDFSELKFNWVVNRHKGRIQTQLAPGAKGALEIKIPGDVKAGDEILLSVTGPANLVMHESRIRLGAKDSVTLPRPASGAPRWNDDGNKIVIEGDGFGLVFDRKKSDFDTTDRRHTSAVTSFPALHVTRYDFGDLNGPNSPPYAVFPDAKTRRFEKIEIKEESSGLRLTVHDRYDQFAGSTSWIIDKNGRGVVSCDYSYSGKPMDTREAGIRFVMAPECDELKWRRWSEWGVFPEESISRTEGSARARRDQKMGPAKWNQLPAWPWSMDETEMGTTDFRSIKYNIYEATVASAKGRGLTVHANADAHIRTALTTGGVTADLLWRCPLGQVSIKEGDRLHGEFVTQIGAIANSVKTRK